jgi:tetratricopeptide (TPR) repeat protein
MEKSLIPAYLYETSAYLNGLSQKEKNELRLNY